MIMKHIRELPKSEARNLYHIVTGLLVSVYGTKHVDNASYVAKLVVEDGQPANFDFITTQIHPQANFRMAGIVASYESKDGVVRREVELIMDRPDGLPSTTIKHVS